MEATSPEPATVAQVYTPAMLAECVQAPEAAIRHWHRRGRLVAEHTIAGEPCFAFEEAVVARRLASLLQAGCSLRQIDRRVSRLERACAGTGRPLSSPSVIVEGNDFVLSTDLGLVEPSGQKLMWESPGFESDGVPLRLRIEDARPDDSEPGPLDWELVDEVESEALRFEREGRLDDAAETYRAVLRETQGAVSKESIAALNVSLAAVLFRSGDFGAARERYLCGVEADPQSVEAMIGLGGVYLATQSPELAVAALQKALELHPDYPDAHFHLAVAFDQLGDPETAEDHWRTFAYLAPDSPWAETARARLSSAESGSR